MVPANEETLFPKVVSLAHIPAVLTSRTEVYMNSCFSETTIASAKILRVRANWEAVGKKCFVNGVSLLFLVPCLQSRIEGEKGKS